MSTKTPVLMTRENPEGWKLEDLLVQIAKELGLKNERIAGDASKLAQDVLRNNNDVIAHLHTAARIQNHSLKILAEVGPDQGPTGTPRIGAGS